MMAGPQQYSLRWNNYLSQLTHALDKHRLNDEFVDVSLLCDGRKIKAHKVVLSACSSYFNEIFTENPHPHPMIIFKFIKYEDLNSIIKFMYQGEVQVEQESLQTFLQTAELLAVHGLNAEGNDKHKQTSTLMSDPNRLNKSIPGSVQTVNIASAANQNVDVHQSVQSHRNFPSASNVHAIATGMGHGQQQYKEKGQDHQMSTQTATSTTLKASLPIPTCSTVASKKRKMTFSDDADNIAHTSDALGEQTLAETGVMNMCETIRMDMPEYILGEVGDHPSTSATSGTQDNIQASGSGEPNIPVIKTEYEILSEPEIDEKYQPVDNAEMTIEMRRLLYPSSSVAQTLLDDTASGSNIAFTGNRRSSADPSESVKKITRMELYTIIKEFKGKMIDEKFSLLEERLAQLTSCPPEETSVLTRSLKSFKTRFKEKWSAARSTDKRFVEKNMEWLNVSLELPTWTRKAGRPTKEFGELCDRSKRQRTEDLRDQVPAAELTYAASVSQCTSGNVDASKIMKENTS